MTCTRLDELFFEILINSDRDNLSWDLKSREILVIEKLSWSVTDDLN